MIPSFAQQSVLLIQSPLDPVQQLYSVIRFHPEKNYDFFFAKETKMW